MQIKTYEVEMNEGQFEEDNAHTATFYAVKDEYTKACQVPNPNYDKNEVFSPLEIGNGGKCQEYNYDAAAAKAKGYYRTRTVTIERYETPKRIVALDTTHPDKGILTVTYK